MTGLLLAALLAVNCVPDLSDVLPDGGGDSFADLLPCRVCRDLMDLMSDVFDTGYHHQTPLCGPVSKGEPASVRTEPSDEEIIENLKWLYLDENFAGWLFSARQTDVRITNKRKIADYIDPPRIYPLIGAAQYHHVHYKCSVTFTETRFYPMLLFVTVRRNTTMDIYVDQDHLHLLKEWKPSAANAP